MKSIVSFFIDHKILVKVIIFGIFLLGIKGTISIPKEGFPSVAINKALVKTIYPGASAKDVEYNVTVLLEEELLEVDGVDKIESISKDNMSLITVTVNQDEDESYFDQVYDKIKDAVDRTENLPSGLKGKPTTEKLTSYDLPVIEVGLSGPIEKVKGYAKELKRSLLRIDEISAVDDVGLPDQEVVITVDSEKATERQIDLKTIAQIVRNRNVEGTGGSFTINKKEFKVVALNRFQSLDELLQTPLRINDDGTGIILKDVAKAEYRDEDKKLIIRNNGEEGVSLLIKKKRGVDILNTMSKINKEIANHPAPVDITLKQMGDQARFTRDRLKMVLSNSLIGVIIVALILFMVLDFRSAFWTAFGIPFCLIATFAFFPLLGQTLNALSLGGFIIMIGILVDDATVIAEQITTFKEQGYSPIEAAKMGVSRVWKPVLAATATTIVAFTPLLSFSGLPGKFIWIIPVVVTIILILSLFESYLLLPTHLLHTLKKKAPEKDWMKKLEHRYRRVLTKFIRYRYITFVFFISCLLLSIFVAKNFVKKDAFPQKGADTFFIDVTLQASTTSGQAISQLIPFEKILSTIPKNELDGYSLRIGTQSEDQRMDQGSQYNLAKFFVYLSPFGERDRTIQEIMKETEDKFQAAQMPNQKFVFNLKRIGPPIGHDFEINVLSNDEEKRLAAVSKIKDFLKDQPGLPQVEDDNIVGPTELNFKIDYTKLASFGLSVQDIVQTLQMTFDGFIISKSVDLNGTLDYRIKVAKETTAAEKFYQNIPIMNARGQLVNISKVVSIEEIPSKGDITHLHGQRVTKVYGNVDKSKTTPDKVIKLVQDQFSSLEGIELHYDGEAIESGKIFKDVKVAAITALLGIYLILALIFNSFKVPFAVMTAIPFLLVGVVWALLTHGEAMGMFSGMAMVGLMGIVVNDSIVMVDTILGLAKEHSYHIDLVIEGASMRLRAIILTTLTTVCGLFPTAYGLGGYDFFISPMCLSMSWGLLFSTIVVLFLLPCLLAIGMDIKNKFSAKRA